jgi:hypothetical protein
VGGAAHQFAGRLLATIGVGFGVAPPSATVEFLHDDLKVNEFPWAGFPHKVGLHDSCSAVRGLGHARPSELSYEPYFASGISRTRRKNMNPRDIILAKPQESTFRRPPEKRLIWRRSLSCAGADRAFGSTFRLWRHGILQVAAQQIDSVCTRSIGYQLYYAYGFRMPENSSHADPAVHVPRE